jgi:hypothetical protein
MEYKVITAQNMISTAKAVAKLADAVNAAIQLGWEPIGGVVLTEHGTVAQAIIKRR